MALPPGFTPASSSFSNRIAAPLDGKTKFATIAERNSCEYLYVGIIVFVTSEAKHYKLDSLPSSSSANWSEFTSEGVGGISTYDTNAEMLAASGLEVGKIAQSNEDDIGGQFLVFTSGALTPDNKNTFAGDNFDFQRDYSLRGNTVQNSAYGNVILNPDTIEDFDPQPVDIANNQLLRFDEAGKGGLFRWNPLVYSGGDGGFIIQKNNGQLIRQDDPNKGVRLEFFGFDVGDLAVKYPSKTYEELKTIRKANLTAFINACNYSKSNFIPVKLPPLKCQIHIDTAGSKVTISDLEKMSVLGEKDLSKLEIFPKVSLPIDVKLFDLENGGNFIGKNFEISSFETKWYRETYLTTLKVGGNVRLIEIDGGETIRSGFWSEIVGKSIFYQEDDTEKAYEAIVSSVNEGLKQITLDRDIDSSITGSNVSTSTSYISIPFEEDETDTNILTFGQKWFDQNENLKFLSIGISHGTYDKEMIVDLENVKSEYLGHFLNRSGGLVHYTERNCKISSRLLGLNYYQGDFANPSTITSYYTRYYNCGTKVVGSANVSGTLTSGQIWGSGCYIHPNVKVTSIGSTYDDGDALQFRQYSASGPKSTYAGFESFFENVTFGKSLEGSVIFSNSMPTTTKNCFFKSKSVILGHNHNDYGSVFYNESSVTFNTNSEPDEQDILLYLSGTTFKYGSSFKKGTWGATKDALLTIHLSNIKVEVGERNEGVVPEIILEITGEGNSKLKKIIIEIVNIYNVGAEESGLESKRPDSYAQGIFDVSNQDIEIIGVKNNHLQIRSNFLLNNVEPNLSKIKIIDSVVFCNSFINTGDSGNPSQFTIINSDVRFGRGIYINGITTFKREQKKEIITLGDTRYNPAHQSVITVSNGFWAFMRNDYYKVKGSVLNHIAPCILETSYNTGDTRNNVELSSLSGRISILFLDDCEITGYHYTDNPDGNIIDSHSFKKGQVGEFELVSYYPLGESELSETVVLGTGDGSTTVFKSTSDATRTKPLIKGSASLLADTIIGTETELGIISGTGIKYGFINYLAERYYIEFDVAPAIGEDVELTYRYVSNPKWNSRWVLVNKLNGSLQTIGKNIGINSTGFGSGNGVESVKTAIAAPSYVDDGDVIRYVQHKQQKIRNEDNNTCYVPISERTIIGSAAILTSNSTPIDLVDAPGADLILEPVRVKLKVYGSSVDYDTNTSLEIKFDGGDVITTIDLSDLPATNKWKVYTLNSFSIPENTKIIAQTSGGNPATGDKAIYLHVDHNVV